MPTSEDPNTRPFVARDWAWLLFALVATLAVFARALPGELVYDDLLLIARNPGITDIGNLPQLFTRPYWDFLDPGSTEQIGYWRPLTAAVWSLCWWLFGAQPEVFHGLSIVTHLATTAVAYLLVKRLTGAEPWICGLATALFGLHPLHVESVAWISAFNDPLFGLFTLATVLAFLRWRDGGSRGAPLAAALFLALGMLSKEMAGASVLLCLGLDLAREHARGGKLRIPHPGRAYHPFLIVGVLWYLARVFVFRSAWAGLDRTPTHFNVDAARMALLHVELLGGGLELLAWPFDLVVFRPFRPNLAWTSSTAWTALGFTAGATALGVVLWKRRAGVALFALLSIPLAFLPALVNVSSLGRFPLSDRFLYVSVLGYVLLLTLALARSLPRAMSLPTLLVLLAAYGWKSWDRIAIWRSEEALFTTAVREAPRSPYLHWGLGRVLLQQAAAGDEQALERALAVFERAGTLLVEAKQPDTDLFVTSNDYLQTNLGLAQCYLVDAQTDDFGGFSTPITILEDLARRIGTLEDGARKARELGMRVVDQHHRLELVYAALGNAHRLAGHTVEADEAYRKAIAFNDRCAEAHMGLGRLNAAAAEWNVSIHHLERAVELLPTDIEPRLALAQVLREAGQRDRAEALALELIEEDDTVPEAPLILAANRLEDRKEREALVWIDRALAADKEHGYGNYLKGMALTTLDVNPQAALEALRRATAVLPNDFAAHYNYGQVLLQQGARKAALLPLIRAYEIGHPVRGGLLYAELMQMEQDLSAGQIYRLARAEGMRGSPETAEVWLDLALKKDPEHPDALFQKGRLLEAQEREDEAEVYLKSAARLLPDNLPMQLELGMFLERRGRLVEALEVLQSALTIEQPSTWEDDAWGSLKQQIERTLERIGQELPSSDIGPQRPPEAGG